MWRYICKLHVFATCLWAQVMLHPVKHRTGHDSQQGNTYKIQVKDGCVIIQI